VSDALPPGQVLTNGFPVLHAGSVPDRLTVQNWTLAVRGAVEAPYQLDLAELLRFPQVEERVDIHCVTSWSKRGTRWQGVPFTQVAERARPRPEARFVVMECEQGFTTSLPLEVLRAPEVLLAHTYEGAPLAPEHGGPVRMLVPSRYFYKSAKWLRALRFVVEDEPGFWEVRGYSNIADPWQATRYDVDDRRVIHRMRKGALFQPIPPAEPPSDDVDHRTGPH
jgi:DMSO/TMAO reductase YedYZ molybdopterin-dependent catalytic subunit